MTEYWIRLYRPEWAPATDPATEQFPTDARTMAEAREEAASYPAECRPEVFTRRVSVSRGYF